MTGLLRSFACAFRGLVETTSAQRNMRLHVVSAILVCLVGSGIPLGLAERVTLLFCVLLVLFGELLNSALEALVDLATRAVDERARHAKDAAAGSVLVLALGSAAILALILAERWPTVRSHLGAVRRQVTLGVPLAACAAALLWARYRGAAGILATFAAAVALWSLTLSRSESLVFSALMLLLLGLCLAAALQRQSSSPRT